MQFSASHVGVIENSARQICLVEFRLEENRSAKICSRQHRATHLGVGQERTGEVHTSKVGAAQDGGRRVDIGGAIHSSGESRHEASQYGARLVSTTLSSRPIPNPHARCSPSFVVPSVVWRAPHARVRGIASCEAWD
jgi:hypothetical protein